MNAVTLEGLADFIRNAVESNARLARVWAVGSVVGEETTPGSGIFTAKPVAVVHCSIEVARNAADPLATETLAKEWTVPAEQAKSTVDELMDVLGANGITPMYGQKPSLIRIG